LKDYIRAKLKTSSFDYQPIAQRQSRFRLDSKTLVFPSILPKSISNLKIFSLTESETPAELGLTLLLFYL